MRRLNKEAPCKTCKIVRMLPENIIVDYVMNKYGSITVYDGKIDPNGIKFLLELEGIENKEITTYKLITYLRTALDTQNKEHTDGGKDNKTES